MLLQFSSPLVQKLEASAESASERELSLESTIQSRVAAELKRLRDAESQALAQTTYDLSKQNIAAESNPELNSVILAADLEELKQKLARRTPSAREMKEVDAKRQSVITCLREKKGRTLDCKSEVENFKNSVRELQVDFIAKYQ